MDQRLSFYTRTVSKWILDRNASILVAAGGINDRDVFYQLGFNEDGFHYSTKNRL